MSQDDLNFMTATQLYDLRLHEQINNLPNSDITFDEDDNIDLNQGDDEEVMYIFTYIDILYYFIFNCVLIFFFRYDLWHLRKVISMIQLIMQA